MAVDVRAFGSSDPDGRGSPMRELRESLFLLALTVSSMGAYLALGVVAVRIFAGR